MSVPLFATPSHLQITELATPQRRHCNLQLHPSYALSIVPSVLFSLSLLAHAIELFHYRTWYFSTLPIALTLEILGWIFRSFSAHKDPYSVIYFVLQYFFIVCAPVFLSASIYSILSVLIKRVGEQYSPIQTKAILAIFITSYAVCTVV